MAAAEAIPFSRTDEFSSKQAENFWQMREDATYTDFTILTGKKSLQVNILLKYGLTKGYKIIILNTLNGIRLAYTYS